MNDGWRRLRQGVYPGASGPVVASAFQRAFALVTVAAWGSLAVQIQVLIGPRGLLPLQPLVAAWGEGGGPSLLDYPSPLRWPALAGEGALLAGTLVGVGLGLLAFLRLRARLCFFLSTLLYLGYTSACRGFLAFQWDNLFIECGLLAAFLPAHRPAPLVHLLLRVAVFKLYFQSGLAKWGSPLGDWKDGSAMAFYYETAPLPTVLGFFAHHLPPLWHRLESWLVLAGELVVPLFVFLGRRLRLAAAALFTLFQLTNLLTANYGFFCYLALALHLFLLDDADLARALGWLRSRLPGRREPAPAPAPVVPPIGTWLRRLGLVAFGLHLGVSGLEALDRFGPPGAWRASLRPLARRYENLRLANSYHLFASVTRERIEPQIEVADGLRPAGDLFRPLDLRYKPGDPARRPPFVAPHQPRVDFLLWFHGLAWQRTPAYLATLLDRLCHQPEAVRGLFAVAPPARPAAVRVTYHRYHFERPAAWRRTGRFWTRTFEATGPQVSCDR